MGLTYRDAGVDIDAGNALAQRIAPLARATTRPEVLSGIGGFAALCGIPGGYEHPILVSGTDGVGTKLDVAHALGRHDTIGIDLVAMAVNDVIVTGAEPLFFLDYFATGALDVDVAADVIAGIAEGCRQAGCALVGGETAELPGFYGGGRYDLAGFCVGVVERDLIRSRDTVSAGDTLIALPSSGLHSNGFSLARRAVAEIGVALDDHVADLGGGAVGEQLLTPTRIYSHALRSLWTDSLRFHGAAHITGGGLLDNPPRMLREGLVARIDLASWERPSLFTWLATAGIAEDELRRTFNLGVGLIVAVAEADADAAVAALTAAGEAPWVLGSIVNRTAGDVEFVGEPR